MENSPISEVVVSRRKPTSLLDTITFAPATAKPFGSETRPLTSAVVTCATAGKTAKTITAARTLKARKEFLYIHILNLPRNVHCLRFLPSIFSCTDRLSMNVFSLGDSRLQLQFARDSQDRARRLVPRQD